MTQICNDAASVDQAATAAPQDAPISAYAQVGAKLIDQGYCAIPIMPGTKAPGEYMRGHWSLMSAWTTRYLSKLPSDREVSIWENAPAGGVCVVLGSQSRDLVAIDIDLDEIVEPVMAVLPYTPVRKRGRKGITLFYWGKHVKSKKMKRPLEGGSMEGMIDILSNGNQTVLPPTIHKDTMQPYEWVGDLSLVEAQDSDIPELPENYMEILEATLRPFGYKPEPEIKRRQEIEAAGEGSGPFDELNKLALANLDAWVPDLGLYKLTRSGQGYRAVPTWRPSQSGKIHSERELNLSIHPDGIRDFVTDEGYNAFKLVVASGNAFDERAAYIWLSDRLQAPVPQDILDSIDRWDEEDDASDAVSDDELLEGVVFDGDDPPAPVPTIVRETIPSQGLTFLGGQSGAGKTFCAIDLAGALATNQPFFGRTTDEKCAVIYIAAEGAATLPARIAAMKIARGVADEKLPIAIIKRAGDLSNREERATVIRRVKAVADKLKGDFDLRVGAVFIDTLGAAFGMKDENSAAEINSVCSKATQIGDAIDAATIVLHHFGKDPSTGLRGSSALRGNGESVISVLGERDELLGTCKNRRLVHTKSRVGEEGLISGFDLQSVQVCTDASGEAIYAAHVALNDNAVMVTKAKPDRIKKASRQVQVYHDALEKALIEYGETRRPFGMSGPEVKAVDREKIRQFFYEQWPADGDEQKKQHARRKAFRRGEDDLLDSKRIAIHEVCGAQLVWAAREGNLADIDWDALKSSS